MIDLQTAARKYIGAKYHHQGRQPWALDCGGLLVLAARDIGIELNDITGYSRIPDGRSIERHLDSIMTRVYRDPIPNDVLLTRIRRNPQHIAIVTDAGIIHSYESSGGVVEHSIDRRWRRRIVAVYEL